MDENTLKKRIDPPDAVAPVRDEIVSAVRRDAAAAPGELPRPGARILPLEAARKRKRRVSRKVPIEDHIGRQLKSLYDDVLSQPIPDRFLELLNELDARAGQAGQLGQAGRGTGK